MSYTLQLNLAPYLQICNQQTNQNYKINNSYALTSFFLLFLLYNVQFVNGFSLKFSVKTTENNLVLEFYYLKVTSQIQKLLMLA